MRKIKKILIAILVRYIRFIEKISDSYITFHFRPRRSDDVGIWSDDLINLPKFSVVVQGPILKEQDFTLETLRIYRKIFKEALIILSTWESEDKAYINKIKNEIPEVSGGFIILLNKEPKYAGTSHRNYQIASSSAGIIEAKRQGASYVLKTRTDQRIYSPNSLNFLFSAIKSFPIKKGLGQKERIIGVSLNSYKYRPYGISDMNIFGHIDDMLLYWDNAEDSSPILTGTDNKKSIIEFIKAGFCNEVHLSTRFLKNIGRDIDWTLKDSWKVMTENFCIVDQHSLSLYWHKYDRHQEYKYLYYNSVRNCQEFTFREWLHLYINKNNIKHISENALNLRWRGKITKQLIGNYENYQQN